MRIWKIFTGVIAGAAVFATANQGVCQINTPVQIKNPLILIVSGKAICQNLEGPFTGNTSTHSFNEKIVYLLVSNYVANASSYSYANIAGTNLPANGYIAFNPNRDLFYVTNKTGFYYPLSGFDANYQYFSWIELDSFVHNGFDSGSFNYGVTYKEPFQLFNAVADYNIDSKGNGFATSTSTAVLYIHDDPYNFDDADNPFVYWENYNPWQGAALGGSDDELGHNNSMIEIRGVLTCRLNFEGAEGNVDINNANFSLSGAGNFYEHDIYNLDGVLTCGQASLAQ